MNKKKLLYTLVFMSVFLSFNMCTELSSLSDETGITLFEVNSISNADVRLGPPVIIDKNSTIEIPLLSGLYEQSVFQVTIVQKNTKSKVLNINTDSLFIRNEISLVHDSLYIRPSNEFYVTAENGSVRRWQVKLAGTIKSSKKDILSFDVQSYESTSALIEVSAKIDPWEKTVKIIMLQPCEFPITINPNIVLSDSARLVDRVLNEPLLFNSLSDEIEIKVQPIDNSTPKTWKIKLEEVGNILEPQLPNSDMELWAKDKSNLMNPVNWTSSNNTVASNLATDTIAPNGSKCAKLQAKSILGKFAAGSLFLGAFKMNLTQINNPRAMSFFGIPFVGKPISVTADLNYRQGGEDMASVEIHVLHYDGPEGDFEYHTYGTKQNGVYVADALLEPGVTVIGYGRDEFSSTNGWISKTVSVTYYSQYVNLPATHLHLAYCTSYRGDQLIGNTNSVMYVDNVQLNY